MKNSNKFKISSSIVIVVKITIACLFILWNTNCFSQDSIWFHNNTFQVGKVAEISETEIRYKKMSHETGPLYIVDRYDVSVIKYENGIVDSFPEVKPWFRPQKKVYYDTVKVDALTPFSIKRTTNNSSIPHSKIISIGRNLLYDGRIYSHSGLGKVLLNETTNPELKKVLRKAESHRKARFLGFLAFPVGLAGLIAAGFTEEPGVAVIGAIGVGVCVGISTSSYTKQKESVQKAIRLYNQGMNE